MSKRSVLVLSNMYPSKESLTFGIFVKNQVEALRERGLHVDVVAVRNPHSGKFNVIKKYLTWVMRILFVLLFYGRKYDVVHCHYIFPTGLFGLLFKKIYKTKLVVTSHGGDINKMAKKSRRLQQYTQRILQQADEVIAVGQGLYDEIHNDYHVPKEKLTLLNMGVDRRVFIPCEKEGARLSLGLLSEAKPLLFVGNLIREKGLIELLYAYKEVKRANRAVELHLIGSKKSQQFYDELQSIIEKEKLQDVFFHEPMPQHLIAQWMAAAEIFVLPSHIEGFGLVALEAMSCHTPIVVSRTGGLTYLAEAGHGILVEPKDFHSLATGIIELLEDEELYKRLIKNGEQRARENDAEIIIDKLIERY